ncbi:MAG TPA: hypothetical protein VGT78_05615 [Rhizomicrobium sp.]|nr:hypothetical protein [Rhizomicrobium sp.]
MKHRLVFALSIVALFAGSTSALAKTICTDWQDLSDGTEVRTCVDDSGRQFCQQQKGDTVSEVTCN